MPTDRWVTGDHFGLSMPADPAAFRVGWHNVSHRGIPRRRACWTPPAPSPGSADSTKSRAEAPAARCVYGSSTTSPSARHTDLFVKFSRDFDNPIRDRGKTQMESEVRFASLSREPGFPITVPATQFADYHRETGTGLLIIGANLSSAPTESSGNTTNASTTRCLSRSNTTARC